MIFHHLHAAVILLFHGQISTYDYIATKKETKITNSNIKCIEINWDCLFIQHRIISTQGQEGERFFSEFKIQNVEILIIQGSKDEIISFWKKNGL